MPGLTIVVDRIREISDALQLAAADAREARAEVEEYRAEVEAASTTSAMERAAGGGGSTMGSSSGASSGGAGMPKAVTVGGLAAALQITRGRS